MTDALLFVLVVLAVYRVTRFLALDDLPPLVWVRNRFEDAVATRHGSDWSSGLMCFWCSGFWVTCAVVTTVWAFRPLPLPGLWYLAVSAAVGLLGMKLED